METVTERFELIGTGMIVLLGFALVVLPEPATSVIGLLLIAIGLSLGISKWRRRSREPNFAEKSPTNIDD